jgi:putative intracellular protease/amidase
VAYAAFKSAAFDVQFATENGKSPECDKRMCEGLTQKLLVRQQLPPFLSHPFGRYILTLVAVAKGAKKSALQMYQQMRASEECNHPLAWSSPGFSLDLFDLVYLPGGHEKSVRQIIDSHTVHRLLADYFPKTRKPGKKAVVAVCHGVMVLSEAKGDDGKSVIHECETTCLPARFEQAAFWATRAFLGDYYKTYGTGSQDVEDSVTAPAAAIPSSSFYLTRLSPR